MELCLWSLQITITPNEGALLIVFAIQAWKIAGTGGIKPTTFYLIGFTWSESNLTWLEWSKNYRMVRLMSFRLWKFAYYVGSPNVCSSIGRFAYYVSFPFPNLQV